MLNTENVMSGAWSRVRKEVTRNRNDACGNTVTIMTWNGMSLPMKTQPSLKDLSLPISSIVT